MCAETSASRTHKFEPRGHRGASAGSTWGLRELPGPPVEREPGLVDSGRSPLSVHLRRPGLLPCWPPAPRTWPDVQGQDRSVCSLGLRGSEQAAGLEGAWRALARAPGRRLGVSLQTQGAFLPTRLHPKQPPGLVDSARLKPCLPGGPNLCFTLRHLEMAGRCCREEPGLQPRLRASGVGEACVGWGYSYLENPHGQRSVADYSPWGSQRVGHD